MTWNPQFATSGPVQIANLALARLGMPPIISSMSPPDGSPESRFAALFYPQALAEIIATHPWNHFTLRGPLSFSKDLGVDYILRYRYAQPRDTVMMWGVFPSKSTLEAVTYLATADSYGNNQTVACGGERLRRWGRWEVGIDPDTQQPVIDSTIPYAWGLWTHMNVAEANFRPLFTEALAWLLASYLAFPLRGEASITDSMRGQYANVLDAAKAMDSREGERGGEQEPPSWIACRYGVDPDYIHADNQT